MKSPERVLRTIGHEEPDKVPAFESAITNDTIMRSYGIAPRNLGGALKVVRYLPFRYKLMMSSLGNRKIVGQGLKNQAKFYRNVGIDICTTLTALYPRKILKGGEFIDEFGRHMRFEYAQDDTEITGYVGGAFRSFEDYQKFDPPDPSWEGRVQAFLAGQDVQRSLNDEIFIIPFTTGLVEVTWEGFGINAFARLLAKPAQAQKVFDDRGKFAVEMTKIMAERGAKLILVFDDWGHKNGLFMRPQQFRQYVLPWMKEICNTAHKNDSHILLHSDGDLSEILPELVATGVDALNPIEPTTANPNYDIFNLKKQYGDRITLVGNVSPVMLAFGDISEIEAYCKKLLRECAPGGGYIYASGHSINPVITINRFKAMQSIREKYGTYPIHVPE